MAKLIALASATLCAAVVAIPAAAAPDRAPGPERAPGLIMRAMLDERAIGLGSDVTPKPAACRGTIAAVGAERAMRRQVRRVRVARHRRALRGNVTLERAARRHSLRLVKRGTFEHSVRLPYARTRAGGQNLARTTTARHAVQLMLQSRSHRRTLLDRRWRLIGVGAARDCSGMVTFTLNFVEGAPRR